MSPNHPPRTRQQRIEWIASHLPAHLQAAYVLGMLAEER